MGCICASNKLSKFLQQNDEHEMQTGTNIEKARGNKRVIDETPVTTNYATAKTLKQKIFEEINSLRYDPKKYCNKIKEIEGKLKLNKKDNKYYLMKSDEMDHIDENIQLKKGPTKFTECIEYLNMIYPLPELVYKSELEVVINDDKSTWTKREKITELLEKRTVVLGRKYSGFGFHYILNVRDPELSVVLQVVDDSNFGLRRRNNILSNKFKYIGISYSDESVKDCFCVYINLGY